MDKREFESERRTYLIIHYFVNQMEKLFKAVNSVTFMEVDLEKLAEAVKVAEDQSLQSDERLRLCRKFVIDIQHYITVLLSIASII